MKNKDDECFKWCVSRALNPVDKNAERITQKLRKQAEELNWNGIDFAMEVDKIDRFEKNNSNISVNVFYLNGSVQPLRISEVVKEHNINLLLIEEDGKKRYCLIKNLSRLLSKQVTKHDGALVFCRRCLNNFSNNEKLEVHKEYCARNECVKIEMPEIKTDKNGEARKPEISFKNWNRLMDVPFVVYAYFEAFLVNMDFCEPDNRSSFTEKYQKHQPHGFYYKIVCPEKIEKLMPKSLLKPLVYRAKNADEDVAQMFVNQLEKDIYNIYQIFGKQKKMIFTIKDMEEFKKSTQCWICNRLLGEDKVRHHCHFTGKFRGAAHSSCNLQFKKPKFTPVFFHNLGGYDFHLFVTKLGKSEGDITCIANNEEIYIFSAKRFKLELIWIKTRMKKISFIKYDFLILPNSWLLLLILL